ncbi:uncharacterized protein LOC143031046 [Oratosquilla oratoria]|uniref:uncharacterized protein LOC143031046 n=1 Tax=Oratosquilla oratoria TaxID=337810 RepID=UPI003F7756C5
MVETGTLCGKKWQSMLKNGKERTQYLYTSRELSDVDIFFPGVEEPVKVHSLILCTNSPVFFAMLNGPLATGKKLTLPKDPRHSFQKLLDHMYLDRMDLESLEEALGVYAMAHKYEMESAMKDCVKYIASNVKAETMPAVLETSVLYEDAALKKKCKEILYRDPDAVMLPEAVSRLSKGSLRALLTDETLAFSSEVVPFRGLIAWGRAQLGQQEEEPSGSALREVIGDDLLREVRFLDMSCDEIVDNVIGTDVLTQKECIHIQCAIRGADPSKFPMTMPLHPTRGRRRQPLKKDGALKKCKKILDRDPDAIMLPETVARLSKEDLRALLTDETLAFSSEVVPFRGLIAWGKAQLGQQEEEEPSGSALREEIGDDLLREVRFLDMSCDEFVDHVVGTDVLTHTECIHILTAIRGADPSTLPRTTPLHPARGGRRGRIPQKGRLSRFRFPPKGLRVTLEPYVRCCLIWCLSSDRNICVHRLDAPGAGTLQIDDLDRGCVAISSASSKGPEFVFAPPAALEAGKGYHVWFTPKTEVVANRASGGSQSVGNVTLERGGMWSLECTLYVCESGSSGSE